MKAIIGSRALDILQNFPKGKIHSVFSKAFNAEFHGELLGFVNTREYLGPYTICIWDGKPVWRELEATRAICWDGGGFRVNGLEIMDFEHIDIYNFKPHIPVPENIKNVKQNIFLLGGFLKEANGRIAYDNLGIYSRLSCFVRDWGEFCRDKPVPTQFPPSARSLIGLGQGLTPSGDDFLSGFMLAVIYSYIYLESRSRADSTGEKDAPDPADKAVYPVVDISALVDGFLYFIRSNASKTHIISRQMLKAAALGEGPKALTDLLECIFSCGIEKKRLADAALRVFSIGSTSGTYMVWGIYTALSSIFENNCGGEPLGIS
jgi:hypothetical protein